MKRSFWRKLIVLVLVFALAGCGAAKEKSEQASSNQSESSVKEETSGSSSEEATLSSANASEEESSLQQPDTSNDLEVFAANYIACVTKNRFNDPYSVVLRHVYVEASDLLEDTMTYYITVTLSANNKMGGTITKTYSGNIHLDNIDVEVYGLYDAIEDVMDPSSEIFIDGIYWSENDTFCAEEPEFELDEEIVQEVYNSLL